MLIITKDFGEIEINEHDIFSFPKGIYAFENFKEFVLLGGDKADGIVWLQAINEGLRFIMLDPFMYIEGYNPEISDTDLDILKAESAKDLTIFIIAVIPDDITKMTVNLKSPVLLNFNKKLGMQTILENNYPTRYSLMDEKRTEVEDNACNK